MRRSRRIGPGIRGAACVIAALFCCATAPAAQTAPPQSSVLTVDAENLFGASAFGQRVARELEAESAALEAENRRIEAELQAEEQSLTEERARSTPEAFRARADAFDAKVTRTRAEQNAKARALQASADQARRRFFSVAGTVLEEVMREAGASVILDARTVLVAVRAVDVTQIAVQRIDTAIGDGADMPAPETSPPTRE